MKDRLPTVNALITLHFPQPGDEPAKTLCLTLAEAKDLHVKLGAIVAPVPDYSVLGTYGIYPAGCIGSRS